MGTVLDASYEIFLIPRFGLLPGFSNFEYEKSRENRKHTSWYSSPSPGAPQGVRTRACSSRICLLRPNLQSPANGRTDRDASGHINHGRNPLPPGRAGSFGIHRQVTVLRIDVDRSNYRKVSSRNPLSEVCGKSSVTITSRRSFREFHHPAAWFATATPRPTRTIAGRTRHPAGGPPVGPIPRHSHLHYQFPCHAPRLVDIYTLLR